MSRPPAKGRCCLVSEQSKNPFVDAGHDHDSCVADAIAMAEALCKTRGERLTPTRRRVLELVWDSHKPAGAYDVLDKLHDEGRRSAPPTVYRALEFLTEQGFVHRIESLNAFVGCAHPGATHRAHFLICQDCGAAAELEDAPLKSALTDAANRAGFIVQKETVEVRGRCPDCQAA